MSHLEVARRKSAHTVIVSAESFYAMTLVPALCRRESCEDLIGRDRVLISRLFASLPTDVSDLQIVCYFRRPDHFAEAWYNQQVKYGSVFFGDFFEFLELVYPALLYSQHMEQWSDIFGRESCNARIYDTIANSTVDDFAQNVLNIKKLSSFVFTRVAVNQRMSRDLLEFKRIVNRSSTYDEMALERRIFDHLGESMNFTEAEPTHYQAFLSPHQRGELLADLAEDMSALQSSFGLPSFPSFDLDDAIVHWRSYPGLARTRQQVLERQYRRIKRHPRFRIERLAIKTRRARKQVFKALKNAGASVLGVAVFQRGLRDE
jgi:hypothetical protein